MVKQNSLSYLFKRNKGIKKALGFPGLKNENCNVIFYRRSFSCPRSLHELFR